MWPRKSQDRSPSPPPEDSRKRSSSDAVMASPRQAAAASSTRFLSLASTTSNSNVQDRGQSSSNTDRRRFFTDKISSAGALFRTEAAQSGTNTASVAPISIPTISSIAKPHISPSKTSYGPSKLVSREMHRLGNLAHLPAGLAPSISQTASLSTMAIPTAGSTPSSMASTSSGDPWGALHVHVLPLFNGEALKIPIEDLNVLVRRHIQAVVSASIPRALGTLENDASELIASGMVTLNAKLAGIDDDKLVGRVVEIWGFFWDQVLTYVEGVLLPLQTDPLLSALNRTPKRPTSPSRSNPKASMSSLSSLQISPYHIDVRTVALRSFRDKVLLPLFPKLYKRLSMFSRDSFQDLTYQQPRLQQMLLVLASQGRSTRVSSFSLTSPPLQQASQGENAVADLLRAIRAPRSSDARNPQTTGPRSRAPSFLSGGVPRDRRGRIAQRAGGLPSLVGIGGPDEDFSDDVLRNHTGAVAELERERERAVLESLRSPGPEPSSRVSGGWGLGAGHVDTHKSMEEDEDLNWDQAQAVVEEMVGMHVHGHRTKSPESIRRRVN